MWRWRFLVREFVLQWHIGDACNLKCKHCYQENHKPVSLEFNKLLDILNQYRELLNKLNVSRKHAERGMVRNVEEVIMDMRKKYKLENCDK